MKLTDINSFEDTIKFFTELKDKGYFKSVTPIRDDSGKIIKVNIEYLDDDDLTEDIIEAMGKELEVPNEE